MSINCCSHTLFSATEAPWSTFPESNIDDVCEAPLAAMHSITKNCNGNEAMSCFIIRDHPEDGQLPTDIATACSRFCTVVRLSNKIFLTVATSSADAVHFSLSSSADVPNGKRKNLSVSTICSSGFLSDIASTRCFHRVSSAHNMLRFRIVKAQGLWATVSFSVAALKQKTLSLRHEW